MTLVVDRPIGIDLGTTHSEVALLDPSERDLLVYADRFGRKTMPSAVAWDERAKDFVVGRKARAQRGSGSPPIESIKRRMGPTADRVGFDVVELDGPTLTKVAPDIAHVGAFHGDGRSAFKALHRHQGRH